MSQVKYDDAKVFDVVKSFLESRDIRFEEQTDPHVIRTGFKGDDLPIEIIIKNNENAGVLSTLSFLPVTIKEEKRLDVAMAVIKANYGKVNGTFDFDLEGGRVIFRIATKYGEQGIDDDILDYMIGLSIHMIDDYNDKFFALATDLMTIEQFMEWCEKN